MKIAYLGPQGTFTEAAYLGFAERGTFGEDYEGIPVRSPREAVDAVHSGEATYACVAIENSVDGAVTATFDALAVQDGVQIYDELDLPIAFAIMTKPGVDISQARTFATHPVAYQQVKGWIEQHAPDVEFRAASSNAAAAAMVAAGEVDMAAAPARAAELYDLCIHADQVADVAGARTRFVVVGRSGTPAPSSGNDRTSVLFTLKNMPGALVGALTEFSLREVDLTRIESRPMAEGLGTYRFYADFAGHITDINVAEALRALYLRCEKLTFLGSWPARDGGELHPSSYHGKGPKMQAAEQWVLQAQGGLVEEERIQRRT